MEEVAVPASSEEEVDTDDNLSFSQRRSLKNKHKRRKRRTKLPQLIEKVINSQVPNISAFANHDDFDDNGEEEEEEKVQLTKDIEENNQSTIEEIKQNMLDPANEKTPMILTNGLIIDEKDDDQDIIHEIKQNLLSPQTRKPFIIANKKDPIIEEEKVEPIPQSNILQQDHQQYPQPPLPPNLKEAEVDALVPKAKKYKVVSNVNELEIDPSDIMNNLDSIKRNIDKVVEQNHKKDNDKKEEKFQFSETYLETETSKFIRLLAQKNSFADDEEDYNVYNSNLIKDKAIIHILQNEMMSIFTLIVGIVEGVMLLSLFVTVNNSNTHFLQKFVSTVYVIQFLSFIVGLLMIPYSFILLNYTKDDNGYHNKTINKYQIMLFIVCSISIFICCMIEFPISDRIHYLHSQDTDYFSEQANVDKLSGDVSRWKKIHLAKFCFLSVIWILCISFFHESKPNEKKEE